MVDYAKRAFEEKDEKLYQAFVAVIKKMLAYSESGKYEMKNRALLKESEFKTKLLTDLAL